MDLGTLVNRMFRLGGRSINIQFTFRNRDFSVALPGDAVFFSVKDVLADREYEYIHGFEIGSIKGVVIDAGAHAGLYSMLASTCAARVYAIEADSVNFQFLDRNVSENQLPNVVRINRALWSRLGRVRMYNPYNNSQLATVVPVDKNAYSTIECITLEDLLKEILDNDPAGRISLLKVDIEGAEFEVFRNLPSGVLRRIDRIVLEVHTGVGSPFELVQILQGSGFHVHLLKRPIVRRNAGSVRLRKNFKLQMGMKIIDTMLRITKYKDRWTLLLFAY